ncbi:hypothetical protein MLD38_033742 [Melastoma candidum]|uniref:Uncharacterized protein n=1 Tax=Melastoma candidum TaxID=119954 RepID=A0ACB9M8A5_9MYRT|nr:hypothetical protein MLD38_033742 [Melastoma candidum]
MDEGPRDFHDDWEILGHGLDSPRSSSVETLDGTDQGIGDEAGGMIKVDYFAVQGSGFYRGGDVSESGDSVGSEKPSWIDPGSDNARYGKGLAADWSDDSGSDEERRFGEFEGKKAEEGRDGVYLHESGKSDDGVPLGAGVGAKGEISLYESVQNEIRKFGDEVPVQNDGVVEGGDDGVGMKDEEEKDNEGVTQEESGRGSGFVWWKVPFELVRYCVMRMNHPVWTFSVAAAVMGVLMLGRKLYRMKQRTRALQLKVAVDDKKVSQVMSRAARLNEAFSVVRRVPIVRPVLPAPGVGPWPAMSLR